MARIFNIYFAFDGMMHNAVVSVRTTPFHIEYTLNNFDDELLELLPGNKILSKSPGQFVFQNTSPENSIDLMNAIIKAVSEHMHATEA
ncbi:MAG TPA: hypothetical protein VL095_04880 [Flavisolibacter sp.]|nr:hypothetical protein [Flavisolibacter sp.]